MINFFILFPLKGGRCQKQKWKCYNETNDKKTFFFNLGLEITLPDETGLPDKNMKK